MENKNYYGEPFHETLMKRFLKDLFDKYAKPRGSYGK